jgi:hypothetical protein
MTTSLGNLCFKLVWVLATFHLRHLIVSLAFPFCCAKRSGQLQMHGEICSLFKSVVLYFITACVRASVHVHMCTHHFLLPSLPLDSRQTQKGPHCSEQMSSAGRAGRTRHAGLEGHCSFLRETQRMQGG